jgi:hypothetical protein
MDTEIALSFVNLSNMASLNVGLEEVSIHHLVLESFIVPTNSKETRCRIFSTERLVRRRNELLLERVDRKPSQTELVV